MIERDSSQFKRVNAAISGDINKFKGQYRVPKKRGRSKGSKNTFKQISEVDLTGDDAAETIKKMVNISSNDEADDEVENNGFVSILQIKARVSTPVSYKRSRIAYISSLSDEETAIDTNADKNTDQDCDGDKMSQFDPNDFRRYPTRIKKSIKKSLPYYSKE